MTRINSFEGYCLNSLKSLYDAEHQIVAGLSKMAEAAMSPRLRNALSNHRQQSERHIQRLDQVFALLAKTPERKECLAIQALLSEGEDLMRELTRGPLLDAALIETMQKIEHYEMAAYSTLRTFYSTLRRFDSHTSKMEVVLLLGTTFQEEADTDRILTTIAETVINPEAAYKPYRRRAETLPTDAAQIFS